MFCFLGFSETGSLQVALAVLKKLSVIRLASNSEIPVSLPLECCDYMRVYVCVHMSHLRVPRENREVSHTLELQMPLSLL